MNTRKLKLLVGIWALTISFQAVASDRVHGGFEAQPLDGVNVKAVETYANPSENEIGAAVSLFPFDHFYSGLGANLSYTHYFSESFAWEVANVGYIFPIQTSITTDLANTYNVTPETIESMRFNLSTSAAFTLIYGKIVFAKKYIRYVRGSLLTGAGLIGTSERNRLVGNLGLRLTMYITDSFSWNMAVRNSTAFQGGLDNYTSFGLGTSVAF